jgi:hypothetical protein
VVAALDLPLPNPLPPFAGYDDEIISRRLVLDSHTTRPRCNVYRDSPSRVFGHSFAANSKRRYYDCFSTREHQIECRHVGKFFKNSGGCCPLAQL